MHDLVFFLAFLVLLFFALKRPFVGISLWLWSGLFVPAYWLYGFASTISYNSIFAAATIIGYFLYRNKPRVRINSVFVFVILFLLHTTITSFYALGPKIIVWMEWQDFFKAILLFIFATLIIRKRIHLNLFLWSVVLSIGFMGFVEGLKFVASGGGHHIKGPSGNILSDNNHMAVALCMTIPLIIYLIAETKEKLIRTGLRFMLVLCILAVMGTFSRGGLIGLVVVIGYFWLRSRHKLKSILIIAVVGLVAYNYLPPAWYSRMQSIDDAMDSASFTTRINSWKIHTLMAMQRPVLGGGFKGPQISDIWQRLAVNIDKFDFIPTPPPGDKGWAAHSIYFQVLGDQGFVGLFLFLSFIILSFVRLSSIEKYYRYHGGKETWQYRLSRMVRLSMLAYCVSGAALSLAYLEMFYAVVAIVVCLDQVVRAAQHSEIGVRQSVDNTSNVSVSQNNNTKVSQ